MCGEPAILKIFYIVNILLTIIKVAVPLIIIVLTTFEIGSQAISNNPEGMKDKVRILANRLILAVLIFYVPTIINVTFGLVSTDYNENNYNCLLNVTKEDIARTEIVNAEEAVTEAELNIDDKSYGKALALVNEIDDESKKQILESRLNVVKTKIQNNQKENSLKTFETLVKQKTSKLTNTSGITSPLNIKYYNQCDIKYRAVKYGNKSYDMCNCGCGYTVIAMIVDTLTNSNKTPIGIVNDLPPLYNTVSNCAMSDATFTSPELKNKYGIESNVVFLRNNKASETETANRKQKIKDTLAKGEPIILLVPGHYIVLGGIEGEQISVYDPASSASNGKMTVDELYEKYKNRKNRCTTQGKCGFVYAVSYRKA